MILQDVDSKNWDMQVLKSEKPVAVDFWAPWCPWCRKLMPELEALSSEYEGKLTIVKLNADQNDDIAQRYGVMGLPTIKMFCQGRPVGEIVGYMPRPNLKTELDRLISVHKQCLESSSPIHE